LSRNIAWLEIRNEEQCEQCERQDGSESTWIDHGARQVKPNKNQKMRELQEGGYAGLIEMLSAEFEEQVGICMRVTSFAGLLSQGG
jgi:hypothetical protein